MSSADTLRVCASGCQFSDLQQAVDAASPGDTILLRAGETFIGNVTLPAKSGSSWITIRSDAPDDQLPPDGVRLVPAGKAGANTSPSLLARLVGSGGPLKSTPVLSTAPGAHHYRLMYVEIDGTGNIGYETLVELGHDTTAPPVTDIVFDRVYVHGHPEKGQKRGIALNGARMDILNSYVSEIMAVNADSQAVAGYHGAGPFRIINNHLEATGENILFGGVDPAVQNLVPTGIEVRRNTITKPLAWRDPILPPPSSAGGWDAGTDGSLAAGTHYFIVVALLETGPSIAHSLGSNEAAVSVSGSRSAALTWSGVRGATRYRIYRGTSSGSQSRYLETPSASTSFTYRGESEEGGAPQTTATHWAIKNLIELKNAQNVIFDGNIIENIWAAGQFGYAIVLTPRNQSGAAPWARVQDVTFTNNIIRHAAGAMQIAGYDNNYTSQQTQRITVRNNLFYDVNPAVWGDYTKTFLIGDGPSAITIDHNTIIHNASSLVYAYGAGQTYGFVFTNNITQHRDYGIMAEGGRPGNYSIDMYFPSSNISYNVFQGGRAADYPSPNTFVTQSQWTDSFYDAGADDYRLRTYSSFYAAGAGGSIPGADLGKIAAAQASSSSAPAAPAEPEPTPEPVPQPLPTTGNTAPVARPGGPYSAGTGAAFTADASASSDAEGAISSYLWRWSDDVVIHAADVPVADVVGSAWVRTSVSDAARGVALHNPDRGAGKMSAPLASPSSYVDVRFYAAAGVPYRFWIRTQAQNDAWNNDSLYVQFSGRVEASGNPVDRIGTAQGASIVLEEGGGAGVAGWGWNDDAYGTLAAPMYFATSGPQTLRIQQREDGIMWDQIVISASTYRSTSPGTTRYDSMIVSPDLGTSRSAVASHTYPVAGTYPLILTVADTGGLAASAVTSVAVTAGGASTPAPDPVQPAPAGADAGGPYSGSLYQTVTFDGSRSSASGSAQYSWSFGDEIVLDTSKMTTAGSRWQKVADGSAASGMAVENAEFGQPKLTTALASPGSYVEATFRAAQGVPYRIWIRMRAASDAWTNDSIFVQFSGAVDASGNPINRIDSSNAMGVVLEEGGGAGVLGWGWADGGYGVLGQPIYFNSNAEQRIRIQQREDGLRIDQIVISAAAFYEYGPGPTKQDNTIVPLFPSESRGAVVSRAFRAAGLFPVTLHVVDGGSTAIATTTVTIR
ncbi:MAG: right-handed parallel beta-helix repeat-containing protein [Acidobacteriota bacterium]|nr:right-handed parallel beta-helix repeat-containing protein [Acidobacteriota bacterium]